MGELNELAQTQAENDAADLEQRGIARVPFGLLVQTEQDAAVVVGAIQLRRDTASRIREQANQMATQAKREANRLEELFRGQLSAYTLKATASGKARSIKLVTGQGGDKPTQMGFRTVKGGLRIVDADAAMNWVQHNGEGDEASAEFVKETVRYAPVADTFKAHFADTGEVPDGCIVTEDEQRFFIKPGK